MNEYLKAYHDALNQGFSEREAERISEEKYEENLMYARKHRIEPDLQYTENEV